MSKIRSEITRGIRAHVEMFAALRESDLQAVEAVARLWAEVIRSGGKLLLFGNGGSAADSQHIAAELVGHFRKNRPPYPAIALTVNTSNLTAIANDYSYDEIFARQVEALGSPLDVAVGLSTSGNSPNVVKALRAAKGRGLRTVALTGRRGGLCADEADIALRAPSDDTARIQELHIALGHIICEIVEADLSAVSEGASAPAVLATPPGTTR